VDKPAQTGFEFGPYLLVPGERELWNGDERLELPPRVFDTLLALVERAGRLVAKDELMRLVWPNTVVEENNLSQTVHLLRKALRDGENETRYVETVPRRGYRFVFPVRAVETNGRTRRRSSVEPSETQPPATPPAPQERQAWITVLPIALALLTGLSLLFWWYHVKAGGRIVIPRSIAVLPLANLSNDPQQEYFADGMTDELITDLAQLHEIKVVSKTSIMQYKGTKKPLREIGRELGVDVVVEGSVLRSGGQVRIMAQLIDTRTDRHLWAQAYEGDLKNVLQLQARVAEAITDEVRLSLSAQERNRLHAVRSFDPEAYDLYLRGRYAFRDRNQAAFETAIAYFKQAAAKDPNFPLPYAGLADCYSLIALFGEGYAAVPEAEANARKALALDDSVAEAHTSLAAADILNWKWNEADQEFHRALELNPNDAQTHQWYGNLLLGPTGRHREAIAELQRALELDPLSRVINADLGYAYFLAGNYDIAYQQYQKVLAMDPSFLPVHYELSLYYEQRGLYDQQISELVKDQILAGRPGVAKRIEQLAGQRRKLWETMAETRGTFDTAAGSDGSMGAAAAAYLRLGQRQLALDALQKSYGRREPYLIYLKVDPTFASLREEPAFRDLERHIGLTP